MKFIVDMNLSPRWVDELSRHGWEAEHWSSIGPGNALDTHNMDHAPNSDGIVLTQDVDFGEILSASGLGKPSVVQIRAQDTSPETIGPRLIAAIHQSRAELDAGAFLSIDPVRSRMRVLPLTRRSQ